MIKALKYYNFLILFVALLNLISAIIDKNWHSAIGWSTTIFEATIILVLFKRFGKYAKY